MGDDRSKVELAKEASNYLRGTIAQELERETARFLEQDVQLLKFHGIYQQDHRDRRQQARQEGKEKDYIFMIRCKIPGGALTAVQYLAEDELAARFAGWGLRITTRQDFQYHGVLKKDLRVLMRAINRAEVTTLGGCGDVERNVMTCPAPYADRVHTQLQEAARLLADRLCPKSRAYHEIWVGGEKVRSTALQAEEEPLYGRTYMPRKFKTAIGLPTDNCVDALTNDIALMATTEGEQVAGYNVYVGGGMGMTHGMEETYPRLASLLGFAPAEELVPAVEGIVTIQRDFGDRTNRKHARMKYLVAEWGTERFHDELACRLGHRLAEPAPVEITGAEDHLGWHDQGDGRLFLGVFVENGRIADSEAVGYRSALRTVVERFRPLVRLTPQQNIILGGLPPSAQREVDHILADHGVASAEALPASLRHSMACPALPTCGLAMAEAERAMPEIIRQFEEALGRLGLAGERIDVRMAGCPNGCTRPYAGEVGIVGRTLGRYNLYVGGSQEGTALAAPLAEAVPTERLVESLVPVLQLYRDSRDPGETFGDFCRRVGRERLAALTAVPVGGGVAPS